MTRCISTFRTRSISGRVILILALAAFGLFECLFGWMGIVFAQVQPPAEEGIPVTDSLVKAKCASCHPGDDSGNMKRISWERSTPEGWELAVQRMMLIDDVDLTAREKAHVVQYLSRNHGLAPEEARLVGYDLERRNHEEDPGIPREVTVACARCHNLARIFSWRRSIDDWKEFSRTHGLRYNFAFGDEVIALVARLTPLHSPEWAAWNRTERRSPAGRWLVTASVLGRIRYFGELQMESAGDDGDFNTRSILQPVEGGAAVVRVGHGRVYGGYSWRGSSKTESGTNFAPDGISNEATEVLTWTRDESSGEGRWFWGQYQELGFDIKIQRALTSATLLGIDRPLLKTGAQSTTIRFFGDGFPAQVSPKDVDLGPGVTVQRIVSNTSAEIAAEVSVAPKAPTGKRSIAFRGSALSNALAVFDRLDYIKVTPESSLAAFGEPARSRGYQQFEAIGFLKGPDGKRHTEDDIELGPVEVTWSTKVFYESDGLTDSVGVMTERGLFVPAANSPKNNFDVWVIAEAKNDRDLDGQPLVGKGYLVVTVPFYVFNGRRYVREFDRWVDDGPAGPLQQ